MKNWIGVILISLILLGGCLQSCTTQNKVLGFMDKNTDFKLKYLADNCKVDTKETITYKDSIVEKEVFVKGDSIQCPDVKTKDGDIIPGKTVKCPDHTIKTFDKLRTITKNVVVENKSKIEYLENELRKRDAVIVSKEEDISRLKKYKLYFFILLGAIGLGVFLKFKSKIF